MVGGSRPRIRYLMVVLSLDMAGYAVAMRLSSGIAFSVSCEVLHPVSCVQKESSGFFQFY